MDPRPFDVPPALPADAAWIDALSDEQCAEVFWLYVESPDEFLRAHPPALLGAALRYALRTIHAQRGVGTSGEAGGQRRMDGEI